MKYIYTLSRILNWIMDGLTASLAVIGLFTLSFLFNNEQFLMETNQDWESVTSGELEEFGWLFIRIGLSFGLGVKIIWSIGEYWNVIGEWTLRDIGQRLDPRQLFSKKV